jgi:hypothetical protein
MNAHKKGVPVTLTDLRQQYGRFGSTNEDKAKTGLLPVLRTPS